MLENGNLGILIHALKCEVSFFDMTKATKERNKYMYDFCRFVCPDFLNRKNPEIAVGVIAHDLARYHGVDIKKLYHQGCKFISKNPDGIAIEEEIPLRKGGGFDYAVKASSLIKRCTGIDIPATNILSTFYESIIDNCLIGPGQQKNKGLCLADLIE